jgi:hypothetical protein
MQKNLIYETGCPVSTSYFKNCSIWLSSRMVGQDVLKWREWYLWGDRTFLIWLLVFEYVWTSLCSFQKSVILFIYLSLVCHLTVYPILLAWSLICIRNFISWWTAGRSCFQRCCRSCSLPMYLLLNAYIWCLIKLWRSCLLNVYQQINAIFQRCLAWTIFTRFLDLGV